MTSRPIVVGTDGSHESLRAVGWAAEEAARRMAPLRIVSVTAASPSAAPYSGSPATVEDALRGLYAQVLRAAAEHAAGLHPGLAVETELLSGPAGRALAGDSPGASMLVVGACGVGGYGEVGLGRVSGYLAQQASCPVVVVRDDEARAVSDEIVVGVRDADEAGDALTFAFERAALGGGRLVAVHAWYWCPPALLVPGGNHYVPASPSGPGRLDISEPPAARRDPVDARARSQAAGARLTEVLNGWRDKYPEVPASQEVVHGHPGRVLAALTRHAGLVVLGRHDRGNCARTGPASVQYAVLNHAEGPVAIVPTA